MPTAWYQHQTHGPASAWLKLKGLLSSGTRQEFKFSCRGAAGTRNSRDNKERSPSTDRCHLIGGKPGRCWWHRGCRRELCFSGFNSRIRVFMHQNPPIQDSPKELASLCCFLHAPRLWLKPNTEISSAKVTEEPDRDSPASLSPPGWHAGVVNNSPEDGSSLSRETRNRTEPEVKWKCALGFQFFSLVKGPTRQIQPDYCSCIDVFF